MNLASHCDVLQSLVFVYFWKFHGKIQLVSLYDRWSTCNVKCTVLYLPRCAKPDNLEWFQQNISTAPASLETVTEKRQNYKSAFAAASSKPAASLDDDNSSSSSDKKTEKMSDKHDDDESATSFCGLVRKNSVKDRTKMLESIMNRRGDQKLAVDESGRCDRPRRHTTEVEKDWNAVTTVGQDGGKDSRRPPLNKKQFGHNNNNNERFRNKLNILKRWPFETIESTPKAQKLKKWSFDMEDDISLIATSTTATTTTNTNDDTNSGKENFHSGQSLSSFSSFSSALSFQSPPRSTGGNSSGGGSGGGTKLSSMNRSLLISSGDEENTFVTSDGLSFLNRSVIAQNSLSYQFVKNTSVCKLIKDYDELFDDTLDLSVADMEFSRVCKDVLKDEDSRELLKRADDDFQRIFCLDINENMIF